MKPFLDKDFLLNNNTGVKLYHNYASSMPIIDYHNHLNPKKIYEDKTFDNISDVWLGGDHYKWRAMRTYGIDENLITGNAEPFEKFMAWAKTIPNLIGNPLYHWTHLELQRYFNIDTILNEDTAKEIYDKCNEQLSQKSHSVRNLLLMQNVKVLCTTDDPIDSLEYHKLIKEDNFEIKVIPSFRPEKVMNIYKDEYSDYLNKLALITKVNINNIDDLVNALSLRVEYFVENGCKVTDHALDIDFYHDTTKEEVNSIMTKRLENKVLSSTEIAKYQGYLLTELGKVYNKHNLIMQLHIGALRNNVSSISVKLGPDTGFDSSTDFNYAPQLSKLLSSLDITNELPKTVLYYLNPKDVDMLSVMIGNYQSNTQGVKGKIQLGSAWWFNDNKLGMTRQLEALANNGVLSTFVGMLTDSRSFLSFPRHEYFRRILCNLIGEWVENGEYPNDETKLEELVEDICFNNVKNYLDI